MSATGADSTEDDKNMPTEAPQVSTVVQVAKAASSVPANIFTETLQDILGFTINQVWVLVDDIYDSQESVLYWEFTDIKEWCQLKSRILASHGGLFYGYRNIKCLQALAWLVAYWTLRDKFTNMNNFKTDIIADAVEESRIDFGDTKDRKGDLNNPNEFSHIKWTQWEDSI